MYGIFNGMNDTVYERVDDDNPKKNGPSITCILIGGLCVVTVLTMYYILTGRYYKYFEDCIKHIFSSRGPTEVRRQT